MSQHATVAAVTALLLAAAPATATNDPGGDVPDIVAGEPMPDERCEANRAAGTITYMTGFDYAAAASMVDVFVADANGYYDDLCLDVEIVASFSTSNYPLIAGGDAHFASAGSFSEVLDFAAANEAELVAVVVEGRFPIDALILKPGTADTLDDLAGATIGVKGRITTAVAAMLAGAGLIEGEDYETVLLDGFDPLAHIAIDGIDGFPGYKSNEPGQLDRAGVEYDLFDPAEYDVPGSFGVIYTNRELLEDHPSAAQDFVRATLRGLADAIADPQAAVDVAFELVTAGGNPNYLSEEGEAYRWRTDAQLLTDSYPEGEALGVPDLDLLQAELDAYAELGLFGGEAPAATDGVDAEIAASVYDDDLTVIWPG